MSVPTQKDTAAPAPSHCYDWYVIEHVHTPERRTDHKLPLEEALRLYAGLDCADKLLGVVRDGIDAVDLAIHWDGRECLPADHRKMDRFRADPVVADAAATGFRCETLSDDPAVRKAVDDMICELYGEENPCTLADYGKTGTAMGGMTFG